MCFDGKNNHLKKNMRKYNNSNNEKNFESITN